jgi:hypothetical protein
MLDTDVLLQPTKNTNNQIVALMALVRANTAALKEIRLDLAACDTVDKANTLAVKIEKAAEDLSMDSQKVAPWIKAEPKDAGGAPIVYGQYPINQPLNPDNPVPWAPDYVPPAPDGSEHKTAQAAAPKAHMDTPKSHHETTGGKR